MRRWHEGPACPILNRMAAFGTLWGRACLITLGFGFALALAGGYEELSNRHLRPGWVRYQPPWATPALVLGIVLIVLSATLLAMDFLRQRRGERKT